MKKWKIYHNPKCSKSRECLVLLEARKLDLEVIEYLKSPPSVSELQSLAKKLNLPLRGFVREKEEIFSSLKTTTEASLLEAMHKHPILIERPIIEYGEKAVVGRPTDVLKAFLKAELD